ARGSDQPGEALGFRRGDATAERRQTVIFPALVVEIARGAPARLGEPSRREHAMKRTVQRAGLELGLAAAQARGLLHDAVTVALVAGEREKHLEFDRTERHMCAQHICAAHACQFQIARWGPTPARVTGCYKET